MHEPKSRSCVPLSKIALSGIRSLVIPKKPISEMTPATINPRYSAGITFFMPGDALTAPQPMIDAMIEKPPSTSG